MKTTTGTTTTSLPCRFTCQGPPTCEDGSTAIVDVPSSGPCDCDTYKCGNYNIAARIIPGIEKKIDTVF